MFVLNELILFIIPQWGNGRVPAAYIDKEINHLKVLLSKYKLNMAKPIYLQVPCCTWIAWPFHMSELLHKMGADMNLKSIVW